MRPRGKAPYQLLFLPTDSAEDPNFVLDELVKTGLTIRGREHINGLFESDNRFTVDQLRLLFEQGRKYGVYLFQDQKRFDSNAFIEKLEELGAGTLDSTQILANLRPAPTGETRNIETF